MTEIGDIIHSDKGLRVVVDRQPIYAQDGATKRDPKTGKQVPIVGPIGYWIHTEPVRKAEA
jgi:hypothetical protein